MLLCSNFTHTHTHTGFASLLNYDRTKNNVLELYVFCIWRKIDGHYAKNKA